MYAWTNTCLSDLCSTDGVPLAPDCHVRRCKPPDVKVGLTPWTGSVTCCRRSLREGQHQCGTDHFADNDHLNFVNNYNLLNRYSLAAYPTAYHNDNLNQISLDKKTPLSGLFSIQLQTQRRVIRWQPLFCFALLDWGQSHSASNYCGAITSVGAAVSFLKSFLSEK